MKKTFKLFLLLFSLTYSQQSFSKTAVFILGMHRSGTSATTGALQLMGLFLGSNLLGKALSNPKGHFEDLETMHLDKAILEELGSIWHDLKPLVIDWKSSQVKNFKQRIKNIWANQLFKSDTFGIKEPRMCLLLPMHVEVAQEEGYEVRIVVVRRNFDEIAKSLSLRGRVPLTIEHGYQLAVKYTQELKKHLDNLNLPTLEIQFDDLVNNTQEVVTKFKQFLPMLDDSLDKRNLVSEFIDKGLKHHSINSNS